MKNSITEDEATEEPKLNKAASRNRAVYRFRVPFFGTFLGKQKRTKKEAVGIPGGIKIKYYNTVISIYDHNRKSAEWNECRNRQHCIDPRIAGIAHH